MVAMTSREYTLIRFFGGWKKSQFKHIPIPNGGFFMVMFIPWDRKQHKFA